MLRTKADIARQSQDDTYLELVLEPMRESSYYKPAFGKNESDGVSLDEFGALYGADPLYHWVGLDSPLMYAAHKAAGGMTSIYRQLGIGCERLLRRIIQDELGLDDVQAAWSYDYAKDDGKMGRHTLDARIDLTHIAAQATQKRVEEWLVQTGTFLGLTTERIGGLRGVVLEVRQGYKSADSKRQNADLRFGLRAYNENYLPIVCIVSTQASWTVCRRYRSAQLLVLLGTLEGPCESTFAFFRDVVGYDLTGFFARNTDRLRADFAEILKALLTPG